MLEVINVETARGGVECWMDIQRGKFPQISQISGNIKIGEPLSVIIFLKDPNKEYDLSVRDCWAFDSENYKDTSTGRIQLSDQKGCSRFVNQKN